MGVPSTCTTHRFSKNMAVLENMDCDPTITPLGDAQKTWVHICHQTVCTRMFSECGLKWWITQMVIKSQMDK